MEKDIRMKVAITGQRPQSIDGDFTYRSDTWRWIYDNLEETFRKINPKKLYIGMALGVDTVAAEVAIKCGIPYVACVPFPGQDGGWDRGQVLHYRMLLEYADATVTVSPGPAEPWKYQKRNEYMVDNADMLVAVWNGFKGGTRNCIEYALRQNVPVYRLDPKTQKIGRYDGTQIISKQGVPA